MTAYSAVPTAHQRHARTTAAAMPAAPVRESGHDAGMLRGICFGLAFVAPFWAAVALVLVRVL